MQTTHNRKTVLDQNAIRRRLHRMALEVAEQNSEEKTVIIAGIMGNGEVVAQNLIEELRALGQFETVYVQVSLNKKDPLEVTFTPAVSLDGQVVILVDDVANTGRTMLYALKPLLNARPRRIQSLVLVERSHKLFPVQTDYSGLSIATTLQEHITVETEGSRITGAWLH